MNTEQKYIQNLYKGYMMPPDKIPLVVSNTILAGYFFGESGLAVVSLFMPIYFLFETLGYWINYGGLIKTLEEISENQTLRARSYSKLALTLSIVIGIILAALVLIFFDNLLKILEVPDNLKLLAQDYGKALAVSGILLILSSYVWQFVKIIGLQSRIRRIYVLIMVVNVIACIICEKIFALGIISLVIGMIFAEIFILIFSGVLLHKNFKSNLFAEIQEPINSAWNLIYAGSSPSAGKFYSLFLVYLFNVFFLHFYGESGVAVFAVLQVAIRICRLHAQVTWQPIPPLFAVEFGDKNVSSLFLIFKTALIRAVIFAVLPAVVIFFGAEFLVTQSSLNPSDYAFAADALKIYSLSVVLAAVNSIFITIYLSTDHKILSNVTEFARSIVAIIFFLTFAAHEYVFWSFLFAEVVAAVILFFGAIIIKQNGNFKTILLLAQEFFKPSLFMVADRKIGFTSEQNERLKEFLSPAALKFLSDWLTLLKKFSDTGKNDFLAIHIFRDDKLCLTLRGTGNLFDYSANAEAISLIKSCTDIRKYKFNSTLGTNNLYLQINE
ncbi:MAG: hypothetical protein IJK81_05090 [Selenomonadaceae bacterium]|nr:hypothetical protein [Selenomonadaceae bacterium]